MRIKKNNRIILIGLFLVIFMLPSITKIIHVSETELHNTPCSHSENNHKTKHDCSTCAVCQFHFTAFTKADFPALDLRISEFNIRIYILYLNNGYTTTYRVKSLRAPPAIS